VATQLIVNADDFGLTRGVNRAVAELWHAGALTSATLMATGAAFEDAVATTQACPGLSVGCHVVLTDGFPVSHPADIPTLMGADEKSFRPSLIEFVWAVMNGRVREEEIAREAYAQIARLQRAGIDVTHVDTHKHTHILPAVARPLLFAAERARVGAIRNPFEERWSIGAGHPKLLRSLEVRALHPLRRKFFAMPQIRSGCVATTDGTIGISATGRLDRNALQQMLATMPAGTWELVTHPGYNDKDLAAITTRLRATRDVERMALTELLPGRTDGPELLGFGALGPFARLRENRQFEPNTGHERFV